MKALQNKVLPSKWFYISIAVLLAVMLLIWNAYGWTKAIVMLPYIGLIYVLGRDHQKKKNPDLIK